VVGPARSGRADQLRVLGEAVVPIVAARAFEVLARRFMERR